MDLLHHVYLLLLGGQLHLAPIQENPERALDLGTGTGSTHHDILRRDNQANRFPWQEFGPSTLPSRCIALVDNEDMLTWPVNIRLRLS